ncbi:Crp/Fnr family transcriptional regulator [Bradyrhizobium sp. SSBR45G]|uniref:Crp/Fnr family transcriptional regulator n=1 Tax=unclassified Bradyrhizobium TaxID=2631580 RepID=UPI002342B846|nr:MULTISPECIES: Crp/Fnr family transcriptional regulator [unclassified Bradyrhizobium]GLH76569.1 Crp/Fnr family transcriptional regulator [Bradyrhizobium sp. SSBR45G]GLH84186.1 Crp/Fnr family transcriptional regulator [Bradyrhizobium sp. SSBR45R]
MSSKHWTDTFPPLQKLPQEIFAQLRQATLIVELPEGSRIFGPGQAPESFLLLLTGTIRVQQTSESGREIVLYRVQAGESCALTTACLMGYEEYQAEGIAETPIRAVAIPRALFDQLIATSREFRQFVFTAFSRRITNLFRVIEEVAFERIDVRLAQKLLELAGAKQQVVATHQDLANELGSAREVITRQLTEFARRGWLRVARGIVEITDRPALARLVQRS